MGNHEQELTHACDSHQGWLNCFILDMPWRHPHHFLSLFCICILRSQQLIKQAHKLAQHHGLLNFQYFLCQCPQVNSPCPHRLVAHQTDSQIGHMLWSIELSILPFSMYIGQQPFTLMNSKKVTPQLLIYLYLSSQVHIF